MGTSYTVTHLNRNINQGQNRHYEKQGKISGICHFSVCLSQTTQHFMCRYEMKDALQQTSALKHHTRSHSALSVMLINNPQRIESYLQHGPAGIAFSVGLLSSARLASVHSGRRRRNYLIFMPSLRVVNTFQPVVLQIVSRYFASCH